MPKETNLAARNDKGEVVLYHDSDYPSPALISRCAYKRRDAASPLRG